jgi:hypothetical protein
MATILIIVIKPMTCITPAIISIVCPTAVLINGMTNDSCSGAIIFVTKCKIKPREIGSIPNHMPVMRP